MKYTLQIIILLFTVNSFSQTGVAHYYKVSNHQFKAQQAQRSNGNQIAGAYGQMGSDLNQFKYTLTFNDSLAVFKKVNDLNETLSQKFAAIFSGYNGPHYTNLKTLTHFRKKEEYLIYNDLKQLDWKLTSENVMINGYKCYKATSQLKFLGVTGEIIRDVVAWYTPELSIPVGPDGFGGLPGLIIQLEYIKVVTRLSKITFTKNIKPFKIPKKGKLVSEDEFKIIMQKKMSR